MSAIPLRHTNRGKYHMTPIPESFVSLLTAKEHDLKIFYITDLQEKNSIADIVNDAQIEAMESPLFREELSHFIKSSYTKEHAGMPGFALEIPGPVSVIIPRLIRKVNLSKQNQKKDDALLKKHTPAFVIIASRNNAAQSWFEAGRLFERLWLEATRISLNCSPLAAAIQSPEHAEKLKKVLKTDWEPQVFFRVGFGEKPFRHSPRFTVEHLLKRA